MASSPNASQRAGSNKTLWNAIMFLLGFLVLYIVILVSCESNDTSTATQNSLPASPAVNGVYKITLNDCLGKNLLKPATFYLDTKSTIWTLDYNNGTKIDYQLISGKEDDPLCGLKARDSNGDKCELCFDISDRNSVKVRFDYGSVTLRCNGRIE